MTASRSAGRRQDTAAMMMASEDERSTARRQRRRVRAVCSARPCSIPTLLAASLILLASGNGAQVAAAYRDGGPGGPSGSVSVSLRRRELLDRASRHRARRAVQQQTSAAKSAPVRPLAPPFPDGPCGGTVVEIPPEDTFGLLDPSLSGSALLLPPRPISVWLPPNYSQDTHLYYPVLYCHDGQNVIEDEDSWTGSSWRLAGALTRLHERGLLHPVVQQEDDGAGDMTCSPMPILVLLPSADGDLVPGVRRRHLEYGDTSNPLARSHADFVAQKVKPLVDALFRTVPGPAGTMAIGSSLGGQAALHLVLRHPEVFGGAAALSPAFQPPTLASVASSLSSLKGEGGGDDNSLTSDAKVLYLDNGGDLDDVTVPWFDFMDHTTEHHWWNPGYFWLDSQLQPGIDAVRLALDAGGVRYKYHREAGGRHNERAWARRIDRPLAHLFGKRR